MPRYFGSENKLEADSLERALREHATGELYLFRTRSAAEGRVPSTGCMEDVEPSKGLADKARRPATAYALNFDPSSLPSFAVTAIAIAIAKRECKQTPSSRVNGSGASSPLSNWEPISSHAIEVKLANMQAAMRAGADVNELDHEPFPHRNWGRPLNCCVDDHLGDMRLTSQNLPLVKLLLDGGADPRLGARGLDEHGVFRQNNGSPLDDLREILAAGEDAAPEWRRDFYREALALMEEAARKLDGMSTIFRSWIWAC
ncbi:MAG: hypothetical protein M1819_001702 [Sarea resinae]|nr:MAG: hypothetical protein M1819_001702 [Sarea resinae]